jgi:hypothetical protein
MVLDPLVRGVSIGSFAMEFDHSLQVGDNFGDFREVIPSQCLIHNPRLVGFVGPAGILLRNPVNHLGNFWVDGECTYYFSQISTTYRF